MNKHMRKIRQQKMKIDTAVFNFSSYAKFEHLAIAAHHYSDVINSYLDQFSRQGAANEKSNDIAVFETEVLELRRQIFKLSVENVESIRATLIAWDTDSSELDIVYRESAAMNSQNDSDDGSMSIEAQRKKLRTSLVEEFLMMLKKAAESGNDLFGVSKTYVDKVTAANKVFSILNVRAISFFKSLSRYVFSILHRNWPVESLRIANVSRCI